MSKVKNEGSVFVYILKKMLPLYVQSVLSLLLLVTISIQGNSSQTDFSSLSANCGETDETHPDPRIQSPWTAAIFIRNDNSSTSTPVFLTSGGLITDSFIVLFLGGTTGRTSENLPYKFAKPSNIIVGLGIKCTEFSSNCFDQHSRFPEVAHVRPYDGPFQKWQNVYGIFIYLKNPVQFTPYIRPGCTIFPQDLKGLSYEVLREHYPQNTESYITGFAHSEHSNIQYLKKLATTTIPATECEAVYRKKYKRSLPHEMTCAKIRPDENGIVKYCMGHNSLRLDKLFGSNSKYFSTGVVTLIPGYKKNKCSPNTYYFFYITSVLEKQFSSRIFGCGSQFACTNTTQCIDWKLVCNGKVECEHGEDEGGQLCATIQ